MTEELNEPAKAAEEIARATGKAIDGLRETGAFFKQVFGESVVDGVGLLADKLKYYRIEKAALLAKKTEARLRERGVKATVPLPPKLGIAIIENATVEDNDELHTLWSKLLANAMDEKTSHQVRHIHASLLKEMEPLDVAILSTVATEKVTNSPEIELSKVHFSRDKMVEEFKVPKETIELSLLNLMRLGCITPGIVQGGISISGHKLSAFKGTEMVHLSPLGLSLFNAMQ